MQHNCFFKQADSLPSCFICLFPSPFSLYLFCPSTLPTKRGKCSGLLLSVFITLRDVVLLCVHTCAFLTREAEEEQHKDTSFVTCKRGCEEHKRASCRHLHNRHNKKIKLIIFFHLKKNTEVCSELQFFFFFSYLFLF